MLIAENIARSFVAEAGISKTDVVLEIGTGAGYLTRYIAQIAKTVITTELDPLMLDLAKKNLSEYHNIQYHLGDAFGGSEVDTEFDFCITSLPYSRSKDFIQWLTLETARKSKYKPAAAILQAEFTEKLMALPGSRNYRIVSVLNQLCFNTEILFPVPRECFSPAPRVRSVAIKLTPKVPFEHPLTRSEYMQLTRIFAFRGRLLRTALRHLAVKLDPKFEVLSEKRVEELTPRQFLEIIREQ